MPFTASTLQIGGYHSYQHRNLQAAQVTITEPDSAVSAFEASSATLLKVCRVGPINGIPQVGHEEHTTCCLFAVVMYRGTFQWMGQYENAALDTG